ncbi:MAG: putative LPS assembly protein LptD [Thermoanaerobaculia bacterium]
MSGSIMVLILSTFQIAQLPQFERINFNVPISAEQGGGAAIGAAGKVEFVREDYVVASGGVSLRYRNLEVLAQRVDVDLKTRVVHAEGDVVLDEGPRRVSGDRLEYDLDSKTGTVYNARAYVAPDLYFYGDEVSKTGEDTYELRDGVVTSCDEEVPDWSFRVSKAKVRVEGFARVYNSRMRMKKVPFLYFPFMAVPAKSERTAGFLFPNFGYSDRQGTQYGLAYFQPIGKSFDTTLYADYYEGGEFSPEPFWALGNEIRYTPSEVTKGRFEGYLVDDPAGDTTRWRVNWQHESNDLPLGTRLVINHTDFSDFDFFQDFARSFNEITLRQIQSSAFLTGSWGNSLVNLLVDRREAFLSQGNTRENRQLPELQYRLNQTQLGNLPLYLSLLSSANYFQLFANGEEFLDYQRADLLPQLTIPLSRWPWLNLSVTAAGRATWWSDSLVDPEEPQPDPAEGEEEPSPFSGEQLTRTTGSAIVNIVGPSFSKVFHKGVGSFGKFKHVIEPRWSYTFASEFEDQDRVLRFDEVDTSAPRELATFSLVNRLLGKPADEDSLYGAREIMSFELSQAFSLREDQPLQRGCVDSNEDGICTAAENVAKQEGPIFAKYRFNPSLYTSLDVNANYSTLFSNLSSLSVSGKTRIGENVSLGTSWFTSFNPQTGDTTGSQVRFTSLLNLFDDKVLFGTAISYDVELDLLQQVSAVLQYTSQCWALRLEGRRYESLSRGLDRDIRLALSLNHIGTFLDLNSSTREQGSGFF